MVREEQIEPNSSSGDQLAIQRKIALDGYDAIALAYSAYRDRFKSRWAIELLGSLLPNGARVLDVGCGAGVPDRGIALGAGISRRRYRPVGFHAEPRARAGAFGGSRPDGHDRAGPRGAIIRRVDRRVLGVPRPARATRAGLLLVSSHAPPGWRRHLEPGNRALGGGRRLPRSPDVLGATTDRRSLSNSSSRRRSRCVRAGRSRTAASGITGSSPREDRCPLAEGVGFEPTVRLGRTTVFKTAPLSHSGTPPPAIIEVRTPLRRGRPALAPRRHG